MQIVRKKYFLFLHGKRQKIPIPDCIGLQYKCNIVTIFNGYFGFFNKI